MNRRKLVILSAAALLCVALVLVGIRSSSAAGAARFVANGGVNSGDCTSFPCATIQYAVTQSTAGDTINVAAGTYAENVDIPGTLTGLTLLGGEASTAFAGRSFAGAGESRVTGTQTTGSSAVFTVRPSGVTIDGFSIRNNVNTLGAASGIVVKNTVNGALITNNIFDGISTADAGGNGTAQAIYLEAGPDGVQIIGNLMNNIHSARSAKGVLLGDNGSTNPSQNISIRGNTITNVTSDVRGAYGVSVGNGGGATSNSGIQILDNTISDLTGGTGAPCPVVNTPAPPHVPAACGWVHAIGLEGEAPGVVINRNSISNLISTTPDKIAIWFENEDASFASGTANGNNLDVTVLAFGMAVHPALTTGSVDGKCNWWGSPSGPTSPSNPGGTGSQVTSNIAYSPWLLSPAPFGSCGGGLSPKDCHKAVEENEKNFNDQQKADKKAFEDQQKLDKQNFDSQPHTKEQKKAFEDQQKSDRKSFEDQQQAAKKAFQEQYKADEKACKDQ